MSNPTNCIICWGSGVQPPHKQGCKGNGIWCKCDMYDPHSCECSYMCQGNKLKFVQRKCLKIYG